MTSERSLFILSLLLISACHSVTEGISLDLAVQASPVEALVDVEGNVLELERFEITLDTFELIFCEDRAARIVRELFLPGLARAHHPTSGVPTVFEGPVAIDLASGDDRTIGVMHPPPGRYCGAMLVFGAAAVEGVVGDSALAHELSLGATLFVTFDEALELSAERLEASVQVSVDAGGAFADVDASEATADALRASLRDAMGGFVSVEIDARAH
jgi:hypothetical protein